MARVDTAYHAYLDDRAHRALDHARVDLPTDVPADFSVHSARSAPSGLLEVAAQHDASVIVLGSSAAGVFGHVALGSVTGWLLHSSPYPVALATRGFRAEPEGRVTRVTVAYGGSEQARIEASDRLRMDGLRTPTSAEVSAPGTPAPTTRRASTPTSTPSSARRANTCRRRPAS